MNSEELEQSLRTEFEGYLKDLFDEIKQEISGFQEKFDNEFKDHKARVDDALADLSSRALADRSLEQSFRESVTEHLRLAKDEGARITATAIAEAEELHGSASAAEEIEEGFQNLNDALKDISGKGSQADILRALIDHSAAYTPRGAFFIVKSEHLVGWRVFGAADADASDLVREISFPLSAPTALGESVDSLATVRGFGNPGEDSEHYLNTLGFGHPDRMVAIPLVVRGRGVAVLYADAGPDGGLVNSAALESLVNVAGLTVELLASGAGPHITEVDTPQRDVEEFSQSQEASPASGFREEYEADEQPVAANTQVPDEAAVGSAEEFEQSADPEAPQMVDQQEHLADTAPETGFSYASPEPEPEPASDYTDDLGSEYAVPVSETTETDGEFADSFEPVQEGMTAEERFEEEVKALYEVTESVEYSEAEPVEAVEHDAFESAVEVSEEPEASFEMVDAGTTSDEEEQVSASGFEFRPSDSSVENDTESAYASSEAETVTDPGYSSLEEEVANAEAAFEEPEPEPQVEAEQPAPAVAETAPAMSSAASPEGSPVGRRRFGERNIDLPIEVDEEERKYHNAARRFARLLVSEIRLYNKEKVKEGCESHDLYDRLKEAIDRSREMYDKRVHGPVAERFDYFNYELVNNLAQGDESKLGGNYPGANN